MIVVDTAVWIDHLRSGSAGLAQLLEDGRVLGHPWVTGELALGHLSRRREILTLLDNLPQAIVATTDEVRTLVEHHELYESGIGYVDAQLLASTRLSLDATLWTIDNRLAAVADHLGCAAAPTTR